MTKFKNVITFKQAQLEPTQDNFNLGMAVAAWLNYTCANYTRNPITGEYIAPVVTLEPMYRIGKTYHKWLKYGILIHTGGFDYANHFIKLPINWLSETHHTTTETHVDPDTGEETQVEVQILNEEVYNQRLHKNSTHCLVWIKDEWYDELKSKITYDSDNNPTNIIAEDKYFTAISNGGEFYVEPDATEE